VGEEFSANGFRTWSARVLAAAALAENQSAPEASTIRRRAVTEAIAKSPINRTTGERRRESCAVEAGGNYYFRSVSTEIFR
jgi:hypothetical protein